MAVGTPLNRKPQNQKYRSFPKQRDEHAYSFKDEQTVAIFHLLNMRGKLKLPKNQRPKE